MAQHLTDKDAQLLDMYRVERLRQFYTELNLIELKIDCADRILRVDCAEKDLRTLNELQEDLTLDGWLVAAVEEIKIFIGSQCIHSYATLARLNKEIKSNGVEEDMVTMTQAAPARTSRATEEVSGQSLVELQLLATALGMPVNSMASKLNSAGIVVFKHQDLMLVNGSDLTSRIFGADTTPIAPSSNGSTNGAATKIAKPAAKTAAKPAARTTSRRPQGTSVKKTAAKKTAAKGADLTIMPPAVEVDHEGAPTATAVDSSSIKRIGTFAIGSSPKATIQNLITAVGAAEDPAKADIVIAALVGEVDNSKSRFYSKIREMLSKDPKHDRAWMTAHWADYAAKIAKAAKGFKKPELTEAIA